MPWRDQLPIYNLTKFHLERSPSVLKHTVVIADNIRCIYDELWLRSKPIRVDISWKMICSYNFFQTIFQQFLLLSQAPFLSLNPVLHFKQIPFSLHFLQFCGHSFGFSEKGVVLNKTKTVVLKSTGHLIHCSLFNLAFISTRNVTRPISCKACIIPTDSFSAILVDMMGIHDTIRNLTTIWSALV